MEEQQEPLQPAQELTPVETRLDSWKEIAAHLNRDVRTVQRWEKSSDLPIHRLRGLKQRSVFAYASELDEWLKRQVPAVLENEAGEESSDPEDESALEETSAADDADNADALAEIDALEPPAEIGRAHV